MAYKLVDVDNRTILQAPIKSYDCSEEADVANLPRFNIPGTQILDDGYDNINNAPCGWGSTALIKGGKVYRLFPDNEWTAL